ncbi:MAG TPA: GyrI-like domain-containing protein [Rubricoccaceae bacterium]|jgi:effector-binding domain-containing protein
MIDTPHVTQTAAQPAAVLRLTIPRSEIQSAMGPARAEVLAAVAAQGIATAGPLFSYHFRMTHETFDFVVGVPVASPVAAVGRVTPGELPASRVAQTVYHGPYEGLGAAWGAFETWIAAEGHARRPDLWERYLVGPEDGADPAAWRTELNHPLVAE